jgi:hypothetical protein
MFALSAALTVLLLETLPAAAAGLSTAKSRWLSPIFRDHNW